MKWDQLVDLVLEKTVKYDDIEIIFKYMDQEFIAYGDAIISTDDARLSDAEVALFGIHDVNERGKMGDEILNPPPELIQKAQFALQKAANDIAAERGDFEGESRHPVWRDPNEPDER